MSARHDQAVSHPEGIVEGMTALTLARTGSFLKWVGGKTRYSAALSALMPEFAGTYREPFMGSAAVFFELAPSKAVLTDANLDLVVAFQQVAADVEAVMGALDEMVNTREAFQVVRALDPGTLPDVERAARLIYLNKTSFRGLWRVNKRGQFNTPYGEYDRPLYNPETMRAASRALEGVEVRHTDFEAAVDEAGRGDFVYLDPPYIPLGGWADFKRYTAEQFGEVDHERLAAAMSRATDRGVGVLMSNSDTPTTRAIFADFELSTMATRRDINLNGGGRASTDLLVSNYELPAAPTLF